MKRALHIAFLCAAGISARAQMLDPSIDRPGEPFCYFSAPTDVIGVMDGEEGTLVTPEGYLYTGSAELMLFTGNPPIPVNQRVKRIDRKAPVIRYEFERDRIRYRVIALAATLDGDPGKPLMNFVRVSATNIDARRRTAFIGAGCRYQNDVNTDWGFGDHRFARPESATAPGGRSQSGERFDREWTYELREDVFLRGGRVLYLFPLSPSPEKRITLQTGDNTPFLAGPQQMDILPSTPAGIVVYRIPLRPGESSSLDFKMPYEPLPSSDPAVAQLRTASFDDYLGRTTAAWEKVFESGIEIELPEPKAAETFDASLLFSLIARNRVGEDVIQMVNEFQYDAFWIRDASAFIRMYDLSGYHGIARECLEYLARWQGADGNFLSQEGQLDGWGQSLSAFGWHYRMTRDTAYAASIHPSVAKAVAWLRRARESDPLRLIPPTTPGDNENISGHITGHNFLALGGLKNAIAIAEGAGEIEAANSYRKEYDDFLNALLIRLRDVSARAGGAIPPGLDSAGGEEWGNMESVYPEQILGPRDPMVTATLAATRKKYAEGLMTYGGGRWLHHYVGIPNTETALIRGEEEQVIRDLYALLLHTGSTHTGFEYCIRPWGTRDFGMNLAPHGWFAARYRALLRNMLLREEGTDLHLFSALSPAWVRPGGRIAVRRAPTEFGGIDAEMTCSETGAVIELSNRFVRNPGRILLHIPWFMAVRSARVDGRPAAVGEGVIEVPATGRRVEIRWEKRKGTPALSYEREVERYKAEYRRRYESFLETGE